MKTTALIPYYGGPAGSGAAVGNCPEDRRQEYLMRTIESLRGFADEIIVGMTDTETNAPADLGGGCWRLHFSAEPRFLPANLVRYGQAYVQSGYVYVTEADQVLHGSTDLTDSVTGTEYLVPHRLEEIYLDKGTGRGQVVVHDQFCYVICNGNPPGGEGFYHPGDLVTGYGGAFLATRELFQEIRFADTDVQPVEQITGFAAYTAGHALKTANWEGFFVEHLSGLDYHKSLT